MVDISNRIKLTRREDGWSISTITSLDGRYGHYETAIIFMNFEWRVVEGYETLEEALLGHEKYEEMTEKEIGNLTYLG